MKDKIKNLLKTSKYKSLSLKDPKEQALADTIMKQQSKELYGVDIQDSSFLNGDTFLGKSTLEIDYLQNETKDLDSLIFHYKQRINSLIMNELKRLLKEFKHNKYEFRYNANAQKVTAALIGQELDLQEIAKVVSGQKLLKGMNC